MELTSGGAQSCDRACPQQPPEVAGPGRGAEPRITAAASCPPSPAATSRGFRGGAAARLPLRGGFHGAPSRTALQRLHGGPAGIFLPDSGQRVMRKAHGHPHKYRAGSVCPPSSPQTQPTGTGSCSPSPASQPRVSGKPRALLRQRPGGDGGEAGGGGGEGDAVAI